MADADAPLPEPVDDAGRRRRPDRRPGRRLVLGRRCSSPYVGDRWRLEELTVNYRTPAEIGGRGRVLAAIDPELTRRGRCARPGSSRWSGERPRASACRVGAVVRDSAGGRIGDGRLGVIVPEARVAELRQAVANEVPDAVSAEAPDLTSPVVVLTVPQAKGLEFDSVLVVDPAGIVAESPRGLNDLYVALTRATQRLGVLHEGDLPKVLSRLQPLDEADLS